MRRSSWPTTVGLGRSIGLLALLCLVLISIVGGAAPGSQSPGPQDVPAEVQAAAEAGLIPLLAPGTVASRSRLGIAENTDLSSLTLGPALQVHAVQPARLIGNPDAGLASAADPLPIWQFMVRDSRGARALLTVGMLNGEWAAVSIGAAGLAQQLDAVFDRWPTATHRLRLIRVYQATSDFVEVTREGRALGLVPMFSARSTLRIEGGFEPSALLNGADVANRLRPAVQAAIRAQGVER